MKITHFNERLIPVVDHGVTLREVPGNIAVYFSFDCCANRCEGCHSPELQQDSGERISLQEMYEKAEYALKKGATAIVLMGIDSCSILTEEGKTLIINVMQSLAPVCLYTSRTLEEALHWNTQWIKTGKFIEERGGLDKQTTNQRFYMKDGGSCFPWEYTDRTNLFID